MHLDFIGREKTMPKVEIYTKSWCPGTDKLTRRRGLALLGGDCNALNVDASAHSERVLRPKDA